MTPRSVVALLVTSGIALVAALLTTEITRVPSLDGLPIEEAHQRLEASRLEAGSMLDFRATEARPIVYSQEPPAGSFVIRGSEVDLILTRDCVRCK